VTRVLNRRPASSVLP